MLTTYTGYMLDVIVIGDTVIDTYIPLLDASIEKSSSSDAASICLPFGHKVPVGNAVSMVAGNGANVAVGLSRLGLRVGIYTHVGNLDDERFDDRIKLKLKQEKVDLRYISETDSLPSNHNIVLTFKNERTILTHHQPWKYELPDLDQVRYIYLTSLSPSVSDSALYEQLVTYLERTGTKLVFQPGTFQIKLGAKKQARLLSLCDLLILNKEESKMLLNKEDSGKADMNELLKKLHDLGPKRVIITDGKNGSFSFDGDEMFELDLFPAKLVEMTGAGDAYACGVTAALLKGNSLSQAMRWGTANSAGVVEEVGPQKGLLHKTKMEEILRKEKNIIAKELTND